MNLGCVKARPSFILSTRATRVLASLATWANFVNTVFSKLLNICLTFSLVLCVFILERPTVNAVHKRVIHLPIHVPHFQRHLLFYSVLIDWMEKRLSSSQFVVSFLRADLLLWDLTKLQRASLPSVSTHFSPHEWSNLWERPGHVSLFKLRSVPLWISFCWSWGLSTVTCLRMNNSHLWVCREHRRGLDLFKFLLLSRSLPVRSGHMTRAAGRVMLFICTCHIFCFCLVSHVCTVCFCVSALTVNKVMF